MCVCVCVCVLSNLADHIINIQDFIYVRIDECIIVHCAYMCNGPLCIHV